MKKETAHWRARGALRSSMGALDSALPTARPGRDGWVFDGQREPAAPLPVARAADLQARALVARGFDVLRDAGVKAAPPVVAPLPSFRRAASAHGRVIKRRVGRYVDCGALLRIEADRLGETLAKARRAARWARKQGADNAPALWAVYERLHDVHADLEARALAAARKAGRSPQGQRVMARRLLARMDRAARADVHAVAVRRHNGAPAHKPIKRDGAGERAAGNRARRDKRPERVAAARALMAGILGYLLR